MDVCLTIGVVKVDKRLHDTLVATDHRIGSHPMRITTEQLQEQQHTGFPVEIISLEGQFYVARITLDEGAFMLSENDETIQFRNVQQVREFLAAYNPGTTELVHTSVYDQMINTDSSPAPARVPLGNNES